MTKKKQENCSGKSLFSASLTMEGNQQEQQKEKIKAEAKRNNGQCLGFTAMEKGMRKKKRYREKIRVYTYDCVSRQGMFSLDRKELRKCGDFRVSERTKGMLGDF